MAKLYKLSLVWTFKIIGTAWKKITQHICFCSNNVELYKVLVKELAGVIDRQFTGNAESRALGMVINTMGWIEGVGYDVFGLWTLAYC